jgi:hypothetical protein
LLADNIGGSNVNQNEEVPVEDKEEIQIVDSVDPEQNIMEEGNNNLG